MTATDWPALAARFEAATDETIYECVREFLAAMIRLHGSSSAPFDVRMWQPCYRIINRAVDAGNPVLLLGVVAACVPEGWDASVATLGSRPARANVTKPSVLRPIPPPYCKAATAPAALGAAVCRAWDEVERAGGKEMVG